MRAEARPERVSTDRVDAVMVRVALLIRGTRLLQAALAVTGGLAGPHRGWLGLGAWCVSAGWSAALARTAWRSGRVTLPQRLVDAAVTVAVLAAVGATLPAPLLTTADYWPMPYAQSAAVMLALPGAGAGWPSAAGLVALLLGYGLAVVRGAGPGALPVAAGSGTGMAVSFAVTVAVGAGLRRFLRRLDEANERARDADVELAVRAARLREFRRLHDDAVQVMELVAAGRCSPALQAAAGRAAARLRSAEGDPDQAPRSLAEALTPLVESFAGLGLRVVLDCPSGGAGAIGAGACSVLADALRESLHNARRHSGAGTVWVRAAPLDGGVEVIVEDRGAGFDASSVRPGFGLDQSIRGRYACQERSACANLRPARRRSPAAVFIETAAAYSRHGRSGRGHRCQ